MKKSVYIYIVGLLAIMAMTAVGLLFFFLAGRVPASVSLSYGGMPEAEALDPFSSIVFECNHRFSYARDSWLKVEASESGDYSVEFPKDLRDEISLHVGKDGCLTFFFDFDQSVASVIDLNMSTPVTVRVPAGALKSIAFDTDICDSPVLEGLMCDSLSLSGNIFCVTLDKCRFANLAIDNIYNLSLSHTAIVQCELTLDMSRDFDLHGDDSSAIWKIMSCSDDYDDTLRFNNVLSIGSIESASGSPLDIDIRIDANCRLSAVRNDSSNPQTEKR